MKIVTHEQAQEAAQRLINSHFGTKGDQARTCIPCQPETDDDCVIMRYIEQQKNRKDWNVKEAEELRNVVTCLHSMGVQGWAMDTLERIVL